MLTPAQKSQYGNSAFIIPKKEGTAMFITDYLKINHKLVRKPYPLARLVKTMRQMERFQYATTLYLTMGY